MTNLAQQLIDGDLFKDSRLIFTSIVLIASFVYADQNIPLDLTLDLDTSDVELIMSREDWREPEDEEENAWRQQQLVEPENTGQWNPESVYEENPELPPLMTDGQMSGSRLDKRKAEPNFKLRF